MPETLATRCCIAGGGPAGMMLGFLLARAGIDVVVLEKHKDFLRDFRGDTIHPSTLELMHELGLLAEFLKLPHARAERLSGRYGSLPLTIADFSHLPTQCKFIALMPQWDFLNFLAERGRRYPGFHLRMQAEARDLIEERGRIVGLRAETPDGALEVRATLVVGCDGRHSDVRAAAGFAVETLGAPMDVLWFRLSSEPTDGQQTGGVFLPGRIFVTLNRGDYWQCAYVIPKGSLEEVHRRGLDAFRADVARVVPDFADRVSEIADWDQVKLLTVAVDRLNRWHKPGLICIGDAAHAMSPIGGVGVNLAVQDAVAAANILAEPLRSGTVSDAALQAVQDRRSFPTRATQRLQLFMQNNVISAVLSDRDELDPPLMLRLLARFPILRRLPARLLGLGFRPEHIRTPERAA
ncbi:MAG: FAD-dependent oxidoreductase [Xanthobacteraceae bacterium]|nr:FAD-dependent oxidoreductase [Xanthobacteraceae bacterium]